jgi:hypothetical protein
VLVGLLEASVIVDPQLAAVQGLITLSIIGLLIISLIPERR